jgi:phage-related protein
MDSILCRAALRERRARPCQFWHNVNVLENPKGLRKLVWLVDSLDRISGFPPVVRSQLGFALYQAQIGHQHESAKILRGFSEAIWQIRADGPGGKYRAVYVAQFGDAVYVLHSFQEKAKSGIATPRRDLELIRQRLQLARRLAESKEQ